MSRREHDEAATRPPGWLTARPIAHRGLHDHAAGVPENSLAAFDAAARAGYPIELDVWLTRDRVPVVFHDETLERLTGAAGPVRAHDAADVSALTIGGTDETIPSLAEALALVDARVPVFIEVKVHRGKLEGLEPAVADVVRHYRGDVAVLSFHPLALGWFRRNAPHIPRGQSSSDFRGVAIQPLVRNALRDLRLNRFSRPHFVAYDIQALPRPRVANLRERGVPVIAWTVATAADQARAEELADNFMFESIRP